MMTSYLHDAFNNSSRLMCYDSAAIYRQRLMLEQQQRQQQQRSRLIELQRLHTMTGDRNHQLTGNFADDTTAPITASRPHDGVGKMETTATMSPYSQHLINWSPADAPVAYERNRSRHQMTSSSTSTHYSAVVGTAESCYYSALSTGVDGPSRTPALVVDGDLEAGKVLAARNHAVYRSWSLASAPSATYLHRDPLNERSCRPASFASTTGCFRSSAASSSAIERRTTALSPFGESSSGSTCSVVGTANGVSAATEREYDNGYHWMKVIGKRCSDVHQLL